MEFFAGQKVVDALIEGMMLPHENLPFPSDALALIGFLQIIADFLKTGIDVLVPGAVVPLAQHLRQPRRAVTEIKAARENDHPGAIRRISAAALGASRIYSERNIRARTDCRERFPLDRASAPVERLAPFFPAFAPHLQVVLLGDLQ